MGSGGPLVEIAGSLLALKHGLLAGHLELRRSRPGLPDRRQPNQSNLSNPLFLKIAFTEMGSAAVVCRKWE